MIIYDECLSKKEVTDVTENSVITHNSTPGNSHYYWVDARTNTMHYLPTDFAFTAEWYAKYRRLLNDLATNGGKMVHIREATMAQKLLGAGFIPLVTLPSFCHSSQLFSKIRDILSDNCIPYLDIYPIRFASSSIRFDKNIKDIWVHRVDVAEKLKINNLFAVTTSAIWKELNLDACFE